MATPDIESPDRTDLKKIDHERFFEAIDSPPLPTEALRPAPCALPFAERRRGHFRETQGLEPRTEFTGFLRFSETR